MLFLSSFTFSVATRADPHLMAVQAALGPIVSPLANPADFGLTRHDDDERLRLDAWRRNVGAQVALDLTTPQATQGTLPAIAAWWC